MKRMECLYPNIELVGTWVDKSSKHRARGCEAVRDERQCSRGIWCSRCSITGCSIQIHQSSQDIYAIHLLYTIRSPST